MDKVDGKAVVSVTTAIISVLIALLVAVVPVGIWVGSIGSDVKTNARDITANKEAAADSARLARDDFKEALATIADRLDRAVATALEIERDRTKEIAAQRATVDALIASVDKLDGSVTRANERSRRNRKR